MNDKENIKNFTFTMLDKIRDLKIILYDCFEQYEDCENIINKLRSLNADKVISSEEYDFIMANYEQWLKDWEERKTKEN